MARIENEKVYKGSDLSSIFFTPMMRGEDITKSGIHVIYNVPSPVSLQHWSRAGQQVLKPYTTSGWAATERTYRQNRSLTLSKVKAEVGYSADDYFALVIDSLKGNQPLDDLSGTELEQAETALFRDAISEGVRATTWFGNTERANGKLNSFNGVITQMMNQIREGSAFFPNTILTDPIELSYIFDAIQAVWDTATEELKSLKSEGNLAFFVSPKVYRAYEDFLFTVANDKAYAITMQGHEKLSWRGIDLIETTSADFLSGELLDLPEDFIMLTDRRNIVLALNTNDMPGSEIKMWYNPDLMENRQRAVFAAAATYILHDYISFAYKMQQ